MTVLELIQRSTDYLARKGFESPRLQAELLLAHVLQTRRMQLYLNFERTVSSSELDTYRDLIRRRAGREPLQHIVGSTSFCGFEIFVNRHVLVPRPETELLAEAGWEFLQQLATSRPSRPPAALDWGTGSGCIAVALAGKCPTANITALDRSAEALAVAGTNASANSVSSRIRFREGDGFAALPQAETFDLVISNPPYIPTPEIDHLQPEVRDFDPRAALDGGVDGLDWINRLLRQSRDFLTNQGKLMLEFGDGQAGSVIQMAADQNWIVEAIREDYTHRPRILIALKKNG